MEHGTTSLQTFLLIALFAGSFLLLCAFAFNGWITHGADIFLSLAQNGMAWCL